MATLGVFILAIICICVFTIPTVIRIVKRHRSKENKK
jgi:hypothetical protein